MKRLMSSCHTDLNKLMSSRGCIDRRPCRQQWRSSCFDSKLLSLRVKLAFEITLILDCVAPMTWATPYPLSAGLIPVSSKAIQIRPFLVSWTFSRESKEHAGALPSLVLSDLSLWSQPITRNYSYQNIATSASQCRCSHYKMSK